MSFREGIPGGGVQGLVDERPHSHGPGLELQRLTFLNWRREKKPTSRQIRNTAPQKAWGDFGGKGKDLTSEGLLRAVERSVSGLTGKSRH